MSAPSVKSFWTCSVAVSLLVMSLVQALSPPEAHAKKRKPRSAEQLTNFLLGPEKSLWLVGPISRIASDDEIDRYLRLSSDEAAAAFIEDFWARRRTTQAVWPATQPEGIFETRALEADRLYSEGPRQGRRSDRGTIHVLYGPPDEVRYEVAVRPGLGPIEVWVYPKKAEKGLDGERPERYYYFVKRGEYTVEIPAPRRQRLRPRAIPR